MYIPSIKEKSIVCTLHMYQNGSDLTVLACNYACLHVRGHPTFSSPLE